MANLKEVKNRINSVISTQQITKAMKMVAAAKLRRAQDNIIQMRPYAQKLGEVLDNVSAGLEAGQSFAVLGPRSSAGSLHHALVEAAQAISAG